MSATQKPRGKFILELDISTEKIKALDISLKKKGVTTAELTQKFISDLYEKSVSKELKDFLGED